MNELPTDRFVEAIRQTHGAEATFVDCAPVCEGFRGETVWEGEVLVFDLQGHPTAPKCYAWSVEGRVTAVLHEGPVDSPEAAVRAVIAARHRCRHCNARVIPEDYACSNCGRIIRF